MKTEGAARKGYIPELDGLRGIAYLLILLYHFFIFIPGAEFGWIGVEIFFCLSGYLITNILLKSRTRQNWYFYFYLRRILRIFPLYFFFLLLLLIVGYFFSPGPYLHFFLKYKLFYFLYLQNWLYVFLQTDPTTFLNHFWTLAVEEQYYLLWPLILLTIKKEIRLLYFLLGAMVSIIGLRTYFLAYPVFNLNWPTLFTYTRIDGLILGSALALLHHYTISGGSRKIKLLFAGLLVFQALCLLYLYFNTPAKPDYKAACGYFLTAAGFSGLIQLVLRKKVKAINRLLSNSFLLFTGRISYGLYIFHWPVYVLLNPPLVTYFRAIALPQTPVLLISALICVAISYLLGYISYTYFEKRFIALKRYFY